MSDGIEQKNYTLIHGTFFITLYDAYRREKHTMNKLVGVERPETRQNARYFKFTVDL